MNWKCMSQPIVGDTEGRNTSEIQICIKGEHFRVFSFRCLLKGSREPGAKKPKTKNPAGFAVAGSYLDIPYWRADHTTDKKSQKALTRISHLCHQSNCIDDVSGYCSSRGDMWWLILPKKVNQEHKKWRAGFFVQQRKAYPTGISWWGMMREILHQPTWFIYLPGFWHHLKKDFLF